MGYYKEGARWSWWAIVGSAALLVVSLLIGTMWLFGWGFFSQATAPFRGETQKRNIVEGSGQYRIAAYDHFFDLCTTIQTKEATLEALQQELDSGPSEKRAEQIRASMTAIRASRAESIAKYNNDANKSYTSGQFRDSRLPYHLDRRSENTLCEV